MIGTIIAIVIGALVLIASIFLYQFADQDFRCLYWFMNFVGTTITVVGLCALYKSKQIEPIDVYQGNTTLQYTIVDGEVNDSVVVWKPGYKK